ncbi:MAG: hypothetical protein LKM37_07940 [Bacteroidales bacterium]|jgi:hypothetical protein|nr:hypothetical protein [Bacteroidales bacterium]
MILSQITRSKMEKVFGREIRYSSDYECLAMDIEERIHEHIGVNTLKRLLGDIPASNEPRLATLDIIAQYLGFPNWDIYSMEFNKGGNSEFSKKLNVKGGTVFELHSSELKKLQKIEIQYYPDRQLILEYLGDDTFKVHKSVNSKLAMDDTFKVSVFYKDYPLFLPSVKNKNGQERGNFTAGKISGLTYINIL